MKKQATRKGRWEKFKDAGGVGYLYHARTFSIEITRVALHGKKHKVVWAASVSLSTSDRHDYFCLHVHAPTLKIAKLQAKDAIWRHAEKMLQELAEVPLSQDVTK